MPVRVMGGGRTPYGSVGAAMVDPLLQALAVQKEDELRQQALQRQAELDAERRAQQALENERYKEEQKYRAEQDALRQNERVTESERQNAELRLRERQAGQPRENKAEAAMYMAELNAATTPEAKRAAQNKLALMGINVPDERDIIQVSPGASLYDRNTGKATFTAPDRDPRETAAGREREKLLPQGIRDYLDSLTTRGLTPEEAQKEMSDAWAGRSGGGWVKKYHPGASYKAAVDYLRDSFVQDPTTRTLYNPAEVPAAARPDLQQHPLFQKAIETLRNPPAGVPPIPLTVPNIELMIKQLQQQGGAGSPTTPAAPPEKPFTTYRHGQPPKR